MRLYTVFRVLLLFGFFAVSVAYFVKRFQSTLDIYWSWYGYLVLVVEMIVAVSILIYSLALTRRVKVSPRGEPAGKVQTVRVLIPCFKETLGVMSTTVEAALTAKVPPGVDKHVYVLDDLPDANKQQWVESKAEAHQGHLHYHTRTRLPVETNGKACNLNAALRRLYGRESPSVAAQAGPSAHDQDLSTELVAVFDADQVCSPEFFTRTLSVMGDSALLLTPQTFSNVDPYKDIFNHVNVQWYEYVLSGMSAWGCVTCTGTNFLVRADALNAIGYFPDDQLGEDNALSIELVQKKLQSKYLPEYLAVGQAPETPAGILTQKSRWVKGHMQIIFGKRNPLLCGGLRYRDRLFYSMANWSLFAVAISTPVFLLVPMINIWFGVFPLDINQSFAPFLVLYYSALLVTVFLTRSASHTYQFWLEWVSNGIYWYTILKAILNVIVATVLGKTVTFKPTAKKAVNPEEQKGDDASSTPSSRSQTTEGSEEGKSSSAIDLFKARRLPKKGKAPKTRVYDKQDWALQGTDGHVLFVFLILSITSALAGLGWVLENGVDSWKVFQLVSSLWCLQNSIPPFLFFYYIFFKGRFMKRAAAVGFAAFVATSIISFVLLIVYARKDYDYGELIEKSFLYFDAQRSGVLPPDVKERVPWRGDSGLMDRTTTGDSLVGGYYDAGDTIKFGLPLAVSMSLLAWGVFEFPKGYPNIDRAHKALLVGTDYMIKCHTGPTEFYVQVGTGGKEHRVWQRPEELLKDEYRVGMMVNATHPGSDVVGSSAAAMAITSLILPDEDKYRSLKPSLLQHAKELYEFAKTYRGKYSDIHEDAKRFYPSTDYLDDLAWAALWLYEATERRELRYLDEAQEHMDSLLQPLKFEKNPSPTFDWDSVSQGACLMLYVETNEDRYRRCIERHLDLWLHEVPKTPKGLAWLRQAGALRQASNTALLYLIFARHLRERGESIGKYGVFECWAHEQIRYMLGDGGRSYVVGYGHNPPQRVHHRGANCPKDIDKCGWDNFRDPKPNANVLVGGLVGGPDQDDVYHDNRTMITQSEVAIDYNAGFTSVLAGLRHMKESSGFGQCYQGKGIIKWFNVIDE